MVFKAKLNNREIKQLAEEYQTALENSKFRINKLILFGSYAKKTSRDWSDVDFLIVSPDFGQKNSFDEAVEVNVVAKKISPLIEAHTATPEEFKNGDSPWLAEAKKYGKEIAL